ncbi:fumarylacetoacetate hydrolase family protein [Cohnella nanjingensis]|uniref:Fumarylacetoacetate hydrolase family protein n=1 Tax=Cohnella nanjingensis TaxID=1387779 RepID=A0A7X0VIM0_9BACL|nr:fumarylacetoacetate hydrolase family protein [Cohnella nanjingensis]MBB6674693.1 fumarylacetoacetate hydrolase family protein [Cohnella nanjingensis]
MIRSFAEHSATEEASSCGWITEVTADEIPDPNDQAIRCRVNGELRQQSRTSDMIFSCDELVSYIFRYMTLEPGDLILIGTPEGVMLGNPEAERTYLKDGDVVTVETEGLGELSNRMTSERRKNDDNE